MKNNLNELIEISQKFGRNPDYILAGGGNSSFKDQDKMWVKASGTSMADINEDGFVCLSREKMQIISQKEYSENTTLREEQVKLDLHDAILFPEGKRPSVEASMHEIIRYPFVMHTHPTLLNGVLCAKNSKEIIYVLFGDDVVYVPYIDPGYVLFKEVDIALQKYRAEKNKEPNIIFLENHGVFVGADTCEEIENIYTKIEKLVSTELSIYPNAVSPTPDSQLFELAGNIKTTLDFNAQFKVLDASSLTMEFVEDIDSFSRVSIPFTPDNIVYCKSKYLFVTEGEDVNKQIEWFTKSNGYCPKVIVFKGKGIVAIEESVKSAQIVMDVFKDMMKVSYLSNSFGGPKPMTQQQIDFIDNWEVENYRRQMSKATK